MGATKGPYQEDVHGIPYKDKPSTLERIISFLKKILEKFLNFVTCGCYPKPKEELHGEVYEAYLMEEERIAVENLLSYLDSNDFKEPDINEERHRALCILTYSDNVELQRSAALCFAELSDRMTSGITEKVLEPLNVLLKSKDVQIQKAASLAISNFALNGPASNRRFILASGAMPTMVGLLSSPNPEVQCNICGCITTLATTEKSKELIVSTGGITPLLALCQSKDVRVQRNAAGAILNITHLQSNRNELVAKGALPVLVHILHAEDCDVQYYSAAALSNMAVNEKHRAMMVAVGYNDVIQRLISLLNSPKEKVKCQACLALRNLASDTDTQVLIVKLDCLPSLHTVIQKCKGETLSAAVACLRNLSIQKNNEINIIQETFLSELRRVVRDSSNFTAQTHAAGTIRNLAAGDQIQKITKSGCIESLLDALLSPHTKLPVLVEITAALAVLADDDATKEMITSFSNGMVFQCLVGLASQMENSEICYNAAGILGQLALAYIPDRILEDHSQGMLYYLQKFLTSTDPSLVHIALWTLVQLLKYDVFIIAYQRFGMQHTVASVLDLHQSDAITELAHTVIRRSAANGEC